MTLDINVNLVAGTDNVVTVAPPLTIVDCEIAPAFEDTARRVPGCDLSVAPRLLGVAAGHDLLRRGHVSPER